LVRELKEKRCDGPDLMGAPVAADSAPASGPEYTTLELGEGSVTYLLLDRKYLREERVNLALPVGLVLAATALYF
jgi:hypothetical protein